MGFKVLGQAALAATTDTDVYTVPASRQAVVSTLVVANRGATAATFRVAVRPAGGTLADGMYIAYDVPIDGNSSYTFTIGITLDETDVVMVRSSTANLSVNLFGQELDA
jgi:hypothetical protein